MDDRAAIDPADLPLYFAYGSNLDPAQMEIRCPGHRVLCRARLHDHVLAFHGESRTWGGAVASVDPRAGSIVHGVVYELGAGDFERLDRAEGYVAPGDSRNSYERVQMPVELENGEMLEVFTYVRSGPEPAGLPTRDYRWAILSGMRHHGLPAEAIAAVSALEVRG
ncbi:MAG: gamma-glutamylcyclotransferase family protein [Candidatus Eisenbacteria bacterium]